MASVPAPAISEVSLLDRLAILASIILSLEQPATAAEKPGSAEHVGTEPATTDASAPAESAASLPLAFEIARLPDVPSADTAAPEAVKATSSVEQRLAAEAGGADPYLPILPPPADAAAKLIFRHGSSTSPTLLNLEVVDDKAASAALSLEKLVVATPLSDVIVSPIPATTFAFTGAAGPNNFDVFVGTGHGNAVDFSGLTGLLAPASPEQGIPGATAHDTSAPNGIFVDLTAHGQTVETASGPVTVQAWQIDADGKAFMPLAHLENIDNVTGTVGNDIIVGNDNANTFTYTAADGTANGQAASYGFDIYYGADAASSNASDGHDTADFSGLGSQASVAAALAEGLDSTLLPHAATGITVDLEQAVKVTTVDPETGDRVSVTGSLVSTIGGSEQTDLALLAWSAHQDGSDGQATIENIVTSGGADAIAGNDAENTVVVTGTGQDGPVYFDGRGGKDTIDFSQLSLSGSNTGIEVHLNQANDNVTDPTGGAQSDVVQVSYLSQVHDGSSAADSGAPVAQLKDVENVVGSRGDDVIEGNNNDNVLAGGGGSDTFVFGDVAVVDGRGVTEIGHDIIRDFRSGGLGDDDYLVFDSRIFNFHDGGNLDWLQQLLTNNQIRDDDQGVIIWIDDNNSVFLQNYQLDDHSGQSHGLSDYSSWIVFV